MKNGGNFIDESSCYPFAALLFCIQMLKACAITTKRRGNNIHICSAHGEEISFPDRESYMRSDYWWTCYATWHNRVHIKTSTSLRFIELHRSIFILIETRKYICCADAFPFNWFFFWFSVLLFGARHRLLISITIVILSQCDGQLPSQNERKMKWNDSIP